MAISKWRTGNGYMTIWLSLVNNFHHFFGASNKPLSGAFYIGAPIFVLVNW